MISFSLQNEWCLAYVVPVVIAILRPLKTIM